jgi:D-3-phosphoglycerate dehydrogenase / 2-oxoglutarate reductase
MRWKVMISAPYMQPVIPRLRLLFDERDIEIVVPVVKERLEETALLAYVGDIDGAICGDDRFTERVLRSARKLKVISKWGTGIDSIDLGACKELGIAVRNTPNAFSEPVADSVMGYILCFARGLLSLNKNMHEGRWEKITGRSLSECALGIVGVGNVGKALVRRAMGFGMQILGTDIIEMPSEFITQTGISMVTKDALLRQSDFVSLNCDLNPTSYHLMNADTFALMKRDAVIINTSRGPVIEEEALVAALRGRRLAGAALDVFETEPLPAHSPLRSMSNAMLAPHNSNSSPQAWERVHLNTIRNLIEGLESDGG